MIFSILHITAHFFILLSFPYAAAASDLLGLLNTWTLAKTGSDIERIQSEHNLIRVSSTPTRGAFQPGWPEAVVTIVLVIISGIGLRKAAKRNREQSPAPKNISFNLSLTVSIITCVAWVASFGIGEASKATAGWISVLGWAVPLMTGLTYVRFDNPVGLIFLFFAVFQWVGSLTVIVQRWCGSMGSIAYEINDARGCIPYGDSLAFLVGGIRSRAFRIMQLVNFVFLSFGCYIMWMMIMEDEDHEDEYPEDFRVHLAKVSCTWICGIIALVEIIYLAIIASKGQPVVISGNCMLVELNPYLEFFDSEIENWWKVLVGLTGI